MTELAWRPSPKCCWCGSAFVTTTIDDRIVYVCPTDECAARQMAWRLNGSDGKLFHLPTPIQCTLEDAIATQKYRFICIGGNRGGGKSVGLRRIAYRYCQKYHDFNVLFLRRMFPELLRNHVQKAIKEAKRFDTKVTSYKMNFPLTDSLIEFGHVNNDDDWKVYVGAEYDLVVFDQLESFTEKQLTEISVCVGRTSHPGWRGLVLAGENPGGPLSAFVDELFITKTRDRKKYPQYNPDNYCFIPTQLDDNPYIEEDYVDFLAGLSQEKREMYRWGRRDVFPGQYFRDKLFVQALNIPSAVPRQGAMRWGFLEGGIFLWLVVLPDGRIYVEREWVFEQILAKDVALTVRAMTALNGHTLTNVQGNRGIKDAEGGEDIFETLARHELHVTTAAHDPVTGWQRLRHWLRPMDNGEPALIVHPSCETLIRTLPQLIASKKDPEDVDEASPSIPAKALRYFVMSRPMPLQFSTGKVYPEGSAGELMQQVIHGNSSDVLGRHNVAR